MLVRPVLNWRYKSLSVVVWPKGTFAKFIEIINYVGKPIKFDRAVRSTLENKSDLV